VLRPLLAVPLGWALCCLSARALSAREHDSPLQERFIQGVNQTSQKLQHISFRARCVVTHTSSNSDKAHTREYEFGIRGRNGLQTGVRDGVTFVQARNDAYAFVLHRSGAGTSVQFIEPVGVDPSVDARIAAVEEEPRVLALASYYLWTEPLARVVERESFEITRVYAAPSGDDEFVRVEFNYSIDDPSQGVHDRFTDGYLVCDPGRQWIVKECGATVLDLNEQRTGTRHTVLEHGDAIGDMPLATKITHTKTSPEIGYTSRFAIHLEVIGRDLPEEELYLSHYGLPEPNFERGWFGTWVWYLIGGVACIIIGVIIVKWRKAAR